MQRTRLNAIALSVAFAAIVACSARAADAQVKPFKITGGGTADKLAVQTDDAVFHDATGTATELGTYSGEGMYVLETLNFVAHLASGDTVDFMRGGRADDEPAAAKSPAAEFKALLAEYAEVEQPREFAPRFLELAEKHPRDPVAVDALAWVAANVRRGTELERAIEILSKSHVASEKLAPLCRHLAQTPSLAAEKLLRDALAKSPHTNVRGQAAFHLAACLKEQLRLAESLNRAPDSARRFEQFYGKEFTAHLRALDAAAVSKEIEQLYERVVKSYANLPADEGTLGQAAEKALFAVRHLSVGGTAPEITGEDIDGKPLKLSSYRGKVVVLDFWGHW